MRGLLRLLRLFGVSGRQRRLGHGRQRAQPAFTKEIFADDDSTSSRYTSSASPWCTTWSPKRFSSSRTSMIGAPCVLIGQRP